MRIAGKALGINDLSEGALLLASDDTSTWPSINDPVSAPNSTDVYYDENMGVFAPVVEKAEVNMLNPFSWFSGDADKALDSAEAGVAPEASGLAGKLLDRKAKQAEMMRMLGR